MGIRHRVPANLPTGTSPGKVAGDNWRDDHTHIPFEVLVWSGITATALAPASAAANAELMAATRGTRRVLDLSQATQFRMTALVVANGNAALAAWKLSYMTTSAATWSNTNAALVGGDLLVGTGTVNTIRDTGWVDLASGARINDCRIAVVVSVAMGSTAPTVGNLVLHFR